MVQLDNLCRDDHTNGSATLNKKQLVLNFACIVILNRLSNLLIINIIPIPSHTITYVQYPLSLFNLYQSYVYDKMSIVA